MSASSTGKLPTSISNDTISVNKIAWPVDREIPKLEWELPAGVRVISSDDHNLEAPGMYEDYIAPKYKAVAPKVWKDETGPHLECEGRNLDSIGQKLLLTQGRPGMADPILRAKDYDSELFDGGFIFAQVSMALFTLEDKNLMIACYDAYNEWLANECARLPGRMYGVAVLPTIYAPENTAEYIQKIKNWGFKAMQIPSNPKDVWYNGSRCEPMWDAIEESGLPLSFHIGENPNYRGKGALGTFLTTGFQPFRRLWALLTFSGVLERHPAMNIIFTEGGISWVPAALYDADKTYLQFESEMRPQLAQPPSYYWHRQCFATFMDDPSGIKLIDDIGFEKVLWSVDYPHPESTLGESAALIKSFFEDLPSEQASAIVGGNAAKLWNI